MQLKTDSMVADVIYSWSRSSKTLVRKDNVFSITAIHYDTKVLFWDRLQFKTTYFWTFIFLNFLLHFLWKLNEKKNRCLIDKMIPANLNWWNLCCFCVTVKPILPSLRLKFNFLNGKCIVYKTTYANSKYCFYFEDYTGIRDITYTLGWVISLETTIRSW